MSDYNEHLDDELKQMNEGGASTKTQADEAIHLNNPITSIGLRKPVTIAGDTSVADCLQLMRDERIGCLLVTDQEKLVGIFTERDVIRRIVGKSLAHAEINVADYMTSDPDTLTADSPLAFALNYMVLGGYRHVPIIDEADHAIGCLSIKDVVKHIGNYYFSQIVNLPPTPKNPGWATMDGG